MIIYRYRVSKWWGLLRMHQERRDGGNFFVIFFKSIVGFALSHSCVFMIMYSTVWGDTNDIMLESTQSAGAADSTEVNTSSAVQLDNNLIYSLGYYMALLLKNASFFVFLICVAFGRVNQMRKGEEERQVVPQLLEPLDSGRRRQILLTTPSLSSATTIWTAFGIKLHTPRQIIECRVAIRARATGTHICPILQDEPRIPVYDPQQPQETYDWECIRDWLKISETNPATRKPLRVGDLRYDKELHDKLDPGHEPFDGFGVDLDTLYGVQGLGSVTSAMALD